MVAFTGTGNPRLALLASDAKRNDFERQEPKTLSN